jgi:hypothetical protein
LIAVDQITPNRAVRLGRDPAAKNDVLAALTLADGRAAHDHAVGNYRWLPATLTPWSQVVWRLWQDHDTYDPARHTARQSLTTAAA